MVDEAIVDCYNDDEQLTGLFTMIEDNLAMPLTTQVLGVEVTVRRVDLVPGGIVAICHLGGIRQAIEILDLPLPHPPRGRYAVDRGVPSLGGQVSIHCGG